MNNVKAFSAASAVSPLAPATIPRREPRADDVVIEMRDINEAYGRMLKSDVKYRFVIDMASLSDEAKP